MKVEQGISVLCNQTYCWFWLHLIKLLFEIGMIARTMKLVGLFWFYGYSLKHVIFSCFVRTNFGKMTHCDSPNIICLFYLHWSMTNNALHKNNVFHMRPVSLGGLRSLARIFFNDLPESKVDSPPPPNITCFFGRECKFYKFKGCAALIAPSPALYAMMLLIVFGLNLSSSGIARDMPAVQLHRLSCVIILPT